MVSDSLGKETSNLIILSLLSGEFPDWGTKSIEPGGAWWPPWIEEMELGAQGGQDSWSLQGIVPQSRKLQRLKTLEMCWSSPSLQLNNSCVCVRKLPENHLKGSEGIIPKAHIAWEWLLLFPLVRVENLTINGTSGRIFRRVLPQ